MMISVSGSVPLEFKWRRARPARLTHLAQARTSKNTPIPTKTAVSIMRPFLFYSLFLVPFTTVLAQVSSLYFASRTTLDDVT
jgi:hypothetical protein